MTHQPDLSTQENHDASGLLDHPPAGESWFRRFIAWGFLAVLLICTVVGVGLRGILYHLILEEAQNQSIHVAGALRDLELSDLMRSEPEAGIAQINEARIADLDGRMRNFLTQFELVKVKIINPQRRIIYSSDLRIIGASVEDDPELDAALNGRVASLSGHGDAVWDLAQEYRPQLDLIETYVPVRDAQGNVAAVVELYRDVGSARRQAHRVLLRSVLVVAGALLVTLAGLSTLIYRAERVIHAKERALRLSDARTHAILDHAADGIVTSDEHGLIRSFNPAAERLFGYEASRVIGTPVERLHTADYAEPTLPSNPAAPCDGVHIGPPRGLRRDGSTFPIRLTRRTLDVDGQTIHALIIHDLTLSTQLEVQRRARDLQKVQHLAQIAQLAAGVAHELRNPLTSVKLLVQQNRESADAPAVVLEDLGIIEQELLRMERSIQTFLDYARPPRPVCREIDLGAVIASVRSLVEGRLRRQAVRWISRTPDAVTWIQADEDQVRQLLLNLVLNALDAMGRGGELELRLEDIDPDFLDLCVLDTGPGVRPDIADRLFEPFITSKEAGTGLGLVICRRIAREHGGELVYQPQERGACFRLRLPRRAPHQDSLTRPQAVAET